jgi:hypothetical protein
MRAVRLAAFSWRFPQTLIPAVGHLYVQSGLHRQDDIEFFLYIYFITMKDAYISSEFTQCIASALQTLFLEELLRSGPARWPLCYCLSVNSFV